MPVFTITQGDLEPALVVALRNSDGSAYVPPNGSTATFKMVRHGTGLVVTGAATIGGPNGDQCTYTWAAGDTDKSGRYDAQFKVTLPNNRTISFPTEAGGCAPAGSGASCIGPVTGGGALALIVVIVPSL